MMGIQLQLILTAYFVNSGWTLVQLHNPITDQAVTSNADDAGRIRENIAKNNVERSEAYQDILQQEKVNGQKTFNKMKEELWTGQSRNANKKKQSYKRSNADEDNVAMEEEVYTPPNKGHGMEMPDRQHCYSESIEIPEVTPTAAIIFLNGRWCSEIENQTEPYMKISFPFPQDVEVELANETVLPGWWDLESVDTVPLEHMEAIGTAANVVHNLIEKEIEAGIPSDRIMVGGFAMAGGLAIYSGLTFPKKLAGVIALSCFIHTNESNPYIPSSMVTANRDIHILQCHGASDSIVLPHYAESTAAILSTFSKNVDFRTYAGVKHSVSKEALNDIKKFMKSRLPPI